MKIFLADQQNSKKSSFYCLLFFAALTAACSDSSSSKSNTISPYDREFDPERSTDYVNDGEDIPEETLLNEAQSAYERGLFSLSREKFSKLREDYPGSYYATLAEIKIADTFFYSADYGAAITAYEEFMRLHPAHEASAYVRYQIANSYRKQYTGPEHDPAPILTAIKNYRLMMEKYPRSEFSVLARNRLDECREALAAHEAGVAEFYDKQGAIPARDARLAYLKSEYPDTEAYRQLAALFNSENTVDKPKAGAPNRPATPEMLSSASLASLVKRAAYKIPPTTNNQFSPATEKTSKSDLILSLKCEESENAFIFTSLLRETVQLKNLPSNDLRTASVLLSAKEIPAISSLSVDENKTLQECQSNKVLLRFLAAKKSEKGNLLQAQLTMPRANMKTHFFFLDRPNRFIALVEK